MKKTEYFEELESLCDVYFERFFIQRYGGANKECLYCRTTDDNKHLEACPTFKYRKLKKELKE